MPAVATRGPSRHGHPDDDASPRTAVKWMRSCHSERLHTMTQNATGLAPEQLIALERLLAGETVTAAAKQAGVSRETVHRWLRKDFGFQAAYNQGRRELTQAIDARLLAVGHRAAENVARAVDEGDLKASLAVLRGLGTLAGKEPVSGPEDAEVLREEVEIAEKEQESSRTFRRLTTLA